MSESRNIDFMSQVSVEIQFERSHLDMDDPGSYINYLWGKILLSEDYEDEREDLEYDEEAGKIIGAFRLIYINTDAAINERIPLEDVYDTNGEAIEFYENAFDNDEYEFNEEVIKIMNGMPGFSQNVLIIDRFGIIPQYRGNRIGRLVINNLVERYSMGASVVAIKPFSFEFGPENIKDNRVEWQDGNAESDIDNSGLMKYYKSMGFENLGNSDFMILDLS